MEVSSEGKIWKGRVLADNWSWGRGLPSGQGVVFSIPKASGESTSCRTRQTNPEPDRVRVSNL